jgi:stage III sporulation protein SpoIIIAA
MVPSRQQQAEVMAEAVAAQRPQVVIIDEMGTQEVSLFLPWWFSSCC